jgi:RHS repeat-associated protein
LLDRADNVAATYQYDPFGVPLAVQGNIGQPMQFSTKPYDAETGLSYYGFRFYSPHMGRWITRDPLGESGGINLYEFAKNNSINLTDPLGLKTESIWDKILKALSVTSSLIAKNNPGSDLIFGLSEAGSFATGITNIGDTASDIYFSDKPVCTINKLNGIGKGGIFIGKTLSKALGALLENRALLLIGARLSDIGLAITVMELAIPMILQMEKQEMEDWRQLRTIYPDLPEVPPTFFK